MSAMKVLGFFLGQELVEIETLFSGLKTLQIHKKLIGLDQDCETMVVGMSMGSLYALQLAQ
jgi:hypothetical protein